jgi:hypothetical protein
MSDGSSPFLFTRRGILVFAGAGLLLRVRGLSAADVNFWDKKPPAEWSSDEIERLITHSPWSKQVTAEAGPSEESGGQSRGGGLRLPGGIGFPGGGGMGRGRGGRGGGRSSESQPKGTVRWESAKPVLEALKTTLPESFAGHYVISVNGFPSTSGYGRGSQDESQGDSPQASQDMLDHLKAYTSLQPKDKALAQPGVVEPQPAAGGTSFLFGFSKEILVLGPDDKEVAFSTRIGRLNIKTKFSLKEMTYRGELAL